ncbi:translation elongation factor 2 (EF-2/EF-G) [Acetanaerobacterium elongatum]|uniref:Translation elongation factor 2 (EF-2/EF-G) n=1 Tax=Acetanaerobacterium elongatum TaxID=258515 RepID=A0A1H0CPJ1_9FIRM|nr:translation elongation factor 2 (EF-2/EF-G) [Acetanaerobacterium elongatum]
MAGHGGSGKTSLAEALLFLTKGTDRLGKVAEGNTICDFDAEEIKRKVSVSASLAPIEFNNSKINLIDTPGLFDFEGGFYEGMRPAESVIIAVSGKSGVTVGMEKAYKYAQKNNKAKIIFVTKMDNDNADFYKVYTALKERFGTAICPVVIPHVENRKVTCYINILEDRAYQYDASGKATEVPVPEDAVHDEILGAISEAIAETDEALMDKFFMGEPFTAEELSKGVVEGTKSGVITPVLCGSGLTLAAVDLLLGAITTLLPTAKEKAGETAKDASGKEVEIACDEAAPLSLFVFKTVADPFVGKLSYFKVVSGKISPEIAPINARTGNPERLGKLIYIKGKKQEDAPSVLAGDIAAVSKLSETVTGDTLCDPKRVVSFESVKFPAPCMSMSIKPKAKGDEGKIAQGIQRLMEEDPSIGFVTNSETHQQLISGLGDQHLDVLVSKLKSKFGVDVSLEKPRVPYRETIRKKVKVQGRHKKQSGGHGQFGDVWIEFEPCDSEDLVFEEKVFGGSVPKNFFPAVEKGLRDCVKHGVLAGYPVVGLKATLVDGSYHPVDSSEMSFKMAASLAYKAALPTASPAILEPIGTAKIMVPDANTGDVISEMNKRRGRVLGMSPTEEKLQMVEAEVPMSEMSDFTTVLRSMTQGRGSFSLTFTRYEQLPSQLEAAVIEDAKLLHQEEEEK